MLDGKGRVLTASGAVVLAVGLPALALLKKDWGLFGVALASGALAFAYWCFEKSAASSREVSAVAVLGAIAAVSRIPFAALPNVQPTTFIVIAVVCLRCLAWGYFYGWIVNFWFWAAFISPPSLRAFLAACAASFGFDTGHALTNLGLSVLLGPRAIRILERFRKKLSFQRDPSD